MAPTHSPPAAPDTTPPASPPPAGSCQLYGVVRARHVTGADAAALPDSVTPVPWADLAGLVAPAPTDQASLRTELLTYTAVLDRLANTGAVVPVRFGTVVTSPETVATEALAPRYDALCRTLDALAGRIQYTVRARYEEDAVVREVLTERPEAVRLHRRLSRTPTRGRATGPSRVDQADRVRLGELVAHGLSRKRETDTRALWQTLQPHTVTAQPQPSRSLEDTRMADVTCLVAYDQCDAFEAAVAELGAQWHGRARLRLLGPMAPYHFAGDPGPAQDTTGRG